jgi:hypothetical protein
VDFHVIPAHYELEAICQWRKKAELTLTRKVFCWDKVVITARCFSTYCDQAKDY